MEEQADGKPAEPEADAVPNPSEEPKPADAPNESIREKSDTLLDRKVSHVRVQEPGQASDQQRKSTQRMSIAMERSGSKLHSEALLKKRSERFSRSRLGLGSVISVRRSMMVSDIGGGKSARYMNTYKLDPDKPFNVEKAEKILEYVMIEALENLTYDPDQCPKKAKWASNAIRAKLKEQEFDRYKMICLVTIGEKQSQDVHVACRFLWDADRDRYATYVHENAHVFGVAMCFAIYYE